MVDSEVAATQAASARIGAAGSSSGEAPGGGISKSAEPALAEAERLVLGLGASAAGFVDVSSIIFRREFRKLCEANRCGSYGKNWMCPPEVGGVEELESNLKTRSKALVFSFIAELKGTFDYNGMMAAAERFAKLVQALGEKAGEALADRSALVLGAGPCKVCEKCAYLASEPCRFPESAVMSLEANGVDVSQLAKLTGLKYNNGPGTVTYFGAVFLNP